ncbi:MAG: hypothetical protein FJ276_32125 [Planctomycetes bacterium]|nr:hypothetical protein [Planctomycetota bacterium]
MISPSCRLPFGWVGIQVDVIVVMLVDMEIAVDDHCNICSASDLDFRLLDLGRGWRLGPQAGSLFRVGQQIDGDVRGERFGGRWVAGGQSFGPDLDSGAATGEQNGEE